MSHLDSPQPLPMLMGTLRQQRAEGELVLEQNDGTRHLFWVDGELVYLVSDAVGEQFGNYLLRQGVLDFPALNELLAAGDQGRLGEKVVLWGLLSAEDRDRHLRTLLGQVMVHALEHSVLRSRWIERRVSVELSRDLNFRLDHRQFVWATFQEAHHLADLTDHLQAQGAWSWQANTEVLPELADLPLTPQMAFALSFLGREPVSFQTLLSLSGLEEEGAARLLATLWALGTLSLVKGEMPSVPKQTPPAKAPVQAAPPVPPTPPPPAPVVLEVIPPTPTPFPDLQLDLEPVQEATLAPESEPAPEPEAEDSPENKARRLFLTARQFLLTERFAEALRALEHSLQLDPDSHQAFDTWLALGKLRLGNPAWSSRAIEAFQNASRLRPKASEPWLMMGELYNRKGFKANAQACYRKALDLDPASPVPQELDLLPEAEPEPVRSSLLGRFKAILTRPDKRN